MVTAVLAGLAVDRARGRLVVEPAAVLRRQQDGKVAIFRGLNADLPGISLSHAYEVTDVDLERLSDIDAETVREGIEADDLDDARSTVDNYAAARTSTE